MKKLLFLLMAILFAITGWTQTLLYETFSSSTYPPTGWTRLTGLASSAFNGTAPTSTTSGWGRVTTGYGITAAHPKLNIYGTSCKYWLVTPTIDLGTGNTANILKFDLAQTAYASSSVATGTRVDDKFMVLISTDNGSTWDSTNVLIKYDNAGSPNVYNNISNTATTVTIPLASYTGQVKIAFYGESTVTGNGDNDLHVGNIMVGTPITCPAPTALANSNVNATGMDLSWTENGSATQWEVAYKINEDSVWNSQIVSTNPYTLSLALGSMYNIKVRSICGDGDTSLYTDVSNFGMPCDVASIPYTQNFDGVWWTGGDTISNASRPWCWINVDGGNTTYNWRSSASSYAGAKSAYYYGTSSSTYSVSDWLISPKLDFTGNQRIKFYAKKSSSTYHPNILIYALDCSTTDMTSKADTANFVLVDSIAAADLTTTYKVFDKPIASLNGTYRIAFVQKLSGQSSVYVDEVQVTDIPSCPDVYYPVATMGTTGQSAKVSFDTTNSNGSGWVIAYGELASGDTVFNPEIAASTVTVNSASELPYEITGLNPNATYYFAIQQNCGGAWSDIVNVTTMPISVTLPYSQDFEATTTDFVFASNSVNKWYIGTATDTTNGSLGGSSLYISDSNGITNHYNTDVSTYAYSLISVDFGNYPEYQLSFAYKLNGEVNSAGTSMYDYLRVYALPTSVGIPVTTGFPTNGTLLGSFATTNNTWQDTSITLTGAEFTDSIKSIVFCWHNDGSDGEQPPVAIDNISIIGSTCAAPDSLTITNLSSTEVTITCHNTNENTPNHYVVSYSVSGTSTWTDETTTTMPYTIQNLTANTDYIVKISAFCSSNAGSIYSEEYNFHTPCTPITTLPYTCNFDADSAGTTAPFISCWQRNSNYLTGNYPYVNSTYSSSSSHSLYFYNSGTTYSIAALPQFDTTLYPINTLQLSFKMRASSLNYKLTVGVMTNALDASTFDSITTVAPSATSTWEQFTTYLTNYAGQGKFIALRSQTGSSNYVYVDDIAVDVIPACATPQQIIIDSISSTSVDVSFTTAHSTDNSWYLYYKESTATVYDSINITTNPYTLSNLTANTSYDIYLATDCGSGTLSAYSDTISFLTTCADYVTIPLNESFDNYGTGSTVYPQCWSRINSYSGNYPYINSTNYSGVGSLYFYASAATSNIAITPMIDSTININTLTASFMYRSSSLDTKFVVGVMTNPTDSTTFTAIDTIQATVTNSWELKLIDLSSYTGTGHYVALWNSGRFSSAYASCYIDNFSLEVTPACPNTYNLVATAQSSDSITLSWLTTNDGGQGWQVLYSQGDATSFNTATATVIDVTTAEVPYTVTNLNPSTVYTFGVRQACGGAVSNLVTTNTIGTAASLPYTCDFEDAAERNSWGMSNGSAVNQFVIGSAVSATPITGYSLYVSNDNGVTNAYTVNAASVATATRLIESSGAGSYQLTFDFKLGGESSFDYLKVFVVDADTSYNGGTELSYFATNSYSNGAVLYGGNNNASATSPYFSNPSNPTTVISDTVTIPYLGEAGTAKKLIFVWRNDASGGTQSPVSIDNISISEIACTTPTSVAVSQISTDQATISWTAGSSDTDWRIYYKESTATEYDSIDVTTNPYTLTDLSASTTYMVGIATNCGTNLSNMSATTTFTTACLPVTTLPWNEGFETITAANEMPSCMTATNLGSKVYTYTAAQSSYNRTPRTGNGFASFKYGSNDYIFTPGFQLTAGTSYDFSFYYRTDNLSGWGPLTAKLCSGQTAADTLSTIGTPIASVTNTAYTQYTGTFTPDSDGIYYIAIYCQATFSPWYLSIDDISLEESPLPCVTPTALTTSNIAITSATVSWTAGGSETSWQVKLGESGSLIDVNTTPSYSFSNLTANTSYTVYVRANCGTNYSNWDSVTFTTAAALTEPTVATVAASGIAQTTATLNGTITAGTNPVIAQGFEWKATSGGTYTTLAGTLSGTALSATLSGLTANTSYTYRAFATTSTGNTYGNEMTFTTSAVVVTPVAVTTVAATSIAQTTATLNGTVTPGTNPVVAEGFAWKTTTNGTYANLAGTLAGTVLTGNLTGLTANTSYTYKAFAVVGTDTTYGTEMTFTTLADTTVIVTPPTVTTVAATSIAQTTATLNGTVAQGTNPVTARGFAWKATANGTYANVVATGTTTITYALTGLTANTGYTYKAFAVVGSDTTYGAEMTFTTLTPVVVPPTVATTAASGIAQTTAILNGTVTVGTNPITAQGFEWKATNGGTYAILVGTLTGATLSATLSGLTASTSYTYKAFATTADTTVYGLEMTFTTSAVVVTPPTVTTDSATVAVTSAVLSGTVAAGSEAITAQGFEWKATNGGTYATVNGTISGTTLSANLINLSAATSYTYRAFVTTASGTVYGAEKTFTTLNSIADVNGNEFSVKLYPNPTEGDATLRVEGLTDNARVIMTDVQGRVISNQEMAAGQKTLTISRNNLASGVYYIRVITNNTTRTEKLIIK